MKKYTILKIIILVIKVFYEGIVIIWKALLNSLSGMSFVIKEKAYKLELAGGIITTAIIIILDKPLIIKMISIILFFLLLIFEIFNTSVEKLCDFVTKEYNPSIKKIKDLASAGVFLMIIINIICFIIFIVLF